MPYDEKQRADDMMRAAAAGAGLPPPEEVDRRIREWLAKTPDQFIGDKLVSADTTGPCPECGGARRLLPPRPGFAGDPGGALCADGHVSNPPKLIVTYTRDVVPNSKEPDPECEECHGTGEVMAVDYNGNVPEPYPTACDCTETRCPCACQCFARVERFDRPCKLCAAAIEEGRAPHAVKALAPPVDNLVHRPFIPLPDPTPEQQRSWGFTDEEIAKLQREKRGPLACESDSKARCSYGPLDELLKACGWTGGTVHQVVEEIRQLRTFRETVLKKMETEGYRPKRPIEDIIRELEYAQVWVPIDSTWSHPHGGQVYVVKGFDVIERTAEVGIRYRKPPTDGADIRDTVEWVRPIEEFRAKFRRCGVSDVPKS